MTDHAFQRCIIPTCAKRYPLNDVLFACRDCGALLDVVYDWNRVRPLDSLSFFGSRRSAATRRAGDGPDASGVWRFRELVPFAAEKDLVTVGEGRTLLQQADELASAVGMKPARLFLQYEGFNPSGSFKDNGMAAACTMARMLDKPRIACASTGNTSASMALYAHRTPTRDGRPMEAIVFIGSDKIALGKLAQALDYGAKTIQIQGDFDACMTLVQQSAARLDLYLMNSVNPFRLEGQKTVIYRILEGLDGEVPDWIVVPGGNLGNTSAFGKALVELRHLGLIERIPRLAVINAAGASALYDLHTEHGIRFNAGRLDHHAIDAYFDMMTAEGRRATTVASAIEIGRPVNLAKALRSLDDTDGLVRQVTDEEILDGKALVGRFGFGCEPASGAAVAGLRRLLDEQVVSGSDRVVCILTGHALKDPQATVNYHTSSIAQPGRPAFANPPVSVPPTIEAIESVLHGA